ncbi:MAG: hypothetical protein JWP59_1893 [Massilia sp.]|nr:hypothetical protein [Massilia sp.]
MRTQGTVLIVRLPEPGVSDSVVGSFLASCDSSFMTASEVPVDGGLAQI